MNIASALLKQVVIQQELDTWSQVKEIYLPNEYRGIFSILEKHVDNYQSLPTFAELKAGQRDQNIQEKILNNEENKSLKWILPSYEIDWT